MVFVVYTSVQGGVRARATSFVALALESERECACAEKTALSPFPFATVNGLNGASITPPLRSPMILYGVCWSLDSTAAWTP